MSAAYKPLVTVVTPSFNHAQYIDDTIRSVFEQEYDNWELIVADDGSTDGSHAVLEKYRDHDKITLLLHKANRGQGIVLNEAIDIAKGDYVCILSSDDIYLPAKLRLQVNKYERCGPDVGIVYSYGATLDDRTGKVEPDLWPVYTGDIFRELIRQQNFIYPISPMFRREVFEKERFWPGYVAEGEALYVRIARHYKAEFVPEVTCAMRKHTYNVGSNVHRMYLDNLKWLEQFERDPGLPPDIYELITRRKAWLHRLKGLEYVRLSRSYFRGLKALTRAVITRPAYALDWKVCAGLIIACVGSLIRPKAEG